MQKLQKVLLYLSLACFIGVIVTLLVDSGSPVLGPLMTGMFVCLALGVRGTDTLFKSFAFTFWIFASVTLAMFYPGLFLEVGNFKLSALIVPLIQIIMFGMGTSLSVKDFMNVLKMPKGVAIGVVLQYSVMPVVGISLALTFGFPAEIAAGVVLIGSSPGGVASNVMAYIANANLALSITLTAVSTLLSPLLTPFLMQLLAGQFVPIEFTSMMWSIIKMIIIPIVLGVLFNRFLHGKMKWLDDAMPVISMVGIAVIITIITAAGRDSLLAVGVLLIVAAIIHNAAGYVFGYWGARALGMEKTSARTVALEVGMQNGGMASGIAVEMGKVATVGLAPAVFGPWMNVTGSTLANYWMRESKAGEAPG
ncbi:bile acid:sodium symporter family protein [Gracilimonas mengyeensis]|uniref:Bile acid:Na+ symporter, BASS family n=1 Tax=Gracilimonas mengyeensis TaxID=1302730 RepID=A0A521DFR8_9BACT|nr:bile acid:sodium symporter family protein [Gracilimonas mengyeensis]SMO70456.1 bile acid:Na+ symporter, BASS family [Gracilimonas mengyeensis]